MTGGSVAFYPFPDDGSQTIHRVISRLPVEHRQAMTWRPSDDWLLEVSKGLAEALSGMFGDAGVLQLDASWKPGAVLVPDGIRTAVQGVLDASGTASKWSRIEGVEFDTARSRGAFEAAI
jgi:hypothetical protein